MIKIIETIAVAILSVIMGCGGAVVLLYETSAPEWAVISLGSIMALQAFIYISSARGQRGGVDAR